MWKNVELYLLVTCLSSSTVSADNLPTIRPDSSQGWELDTNQEIFEF